MDNQELQKLVEEISLASFGKPFRHHATFNARLQTTGGRYLLRSHNIEINPKQLEMHGEDEMAAIIKHELCHYHLHLEKKGYKHKDIDFMSLLQQVGGTRYCKAAVPQRTVKTRYIYQCADCAKKFERKRRVDIRKYRCGSCMGKLLLLSTYRHS